MKRRQRSSRPTWINGFERPGLARAVWLFDNEPVLRARLASWLALAVIAVAAPTAEAYPEFQFSTGNARCSLCHFAPAGGGLINGYGRSEAEDISTFGGNGNFLYGIWKEPKWIKLGVDFRVAFLGRDNGSDSDLVVFPMQGDTYANFRFADFSASIIVGPRAAARTPRAAFIERFNSREHWVMWRPKSTGSYARVGRFYAPFGLRQQDHTVFTRRYLGFHSFEETYNISGGYIKNDWETHLTLFAPGPGPLQTVLGGGPATFGASGYYERRIADSTGAIGGQAKLAITDASTRFIAGGIGKYYLEDLKLLVMGELDVGVEAFDADDSPSRTQLTGYLGLTYFPMNGVMVGTAIQRHDPDISIADTGFDAVQLSVQWFVRSHIEAHLLSRVEFSGDYQKPRGMGLFILHYWL